ncbi:MAG: hypothetical protein H6705_19625 [Myxococcales bacterium]|nr:hypothetical protein [Myxococcales bacterium]
MMRHGMRHTFITLGLAMGLTACGPEGTDDFSADDTAEELGAAGGRPIGGAQAPGGGDAPPPARR